MANRYRASDFNFFSDPDLPPEMNLAAAIIRRAISDARIIRRHRAQKRDTYSDLYNAAELREFFRSQWCGVLLASADISVDSLLQEVG